MAKTNKNWENNAIQFPRLIAEMEAAGVFTPQVYNTLCAEMDLEVEELSELIERAQTSFDKIKARIK